MEFGYEETSFMSLYRKSAGVLQDVCDFPLDVFDFLQDVRK